MEIDLSKVIIYSKDSLQSRALMRSIMLDLYPGKTREMNVLLDVYESGIPKKIKNDGSITDAKYAQYVQKIVDDYGMQEQWAVVGLNAWIDVCLGKGISEKINFQRKESISNTPNNIWGNICKNRIVPRAINDLENIVGDYVYSELGNSEVEITKFQGFDTALISIPQCIDGKRVVSIGKDAFAACKFLEEVYIPEGITAIKNGAFRNCSGLKKVYLSNTLKSLGTWVNSKSDVKYIGEDGQGCFFACGLLEIDIPDSVEFIGPGTFSVCSKLTNVKMPKTLFYLGNAAFKRTAIKKINIPIGLSYINDRCFWHCDRLQNVNIPNEIKFIGVESFAGCSSLKKIYLPNGIERIDKGAFSGCKRLEEILLSDGLKRISEEAFFACALIKRLFIPKTVQFIGDRLFENYTINQKEKELICYPGSIAIDYARKYGYKAINVNTFQS